MMKIHFKWLIEFTLIAILSPEQINHCEGNSDGSLCIVQLQSLEANLESSGQEPVQYEAVYQALDPKPLEWEKQFLFIFEM